MYGKQELENIEYKKLNYKNFENVIFLVVAIVLQFTTIVPQCTNVLQKWVQAMLSNCNNNNNNTFPPLHITH